MLENPLRALWAAGKPVYNAWINFAYSWSAEIMAHAGLDSLTVDMQHGMADFGALIPILQAIGTRNVPTLVRVAWNEPGLIAQILDAGAYGVICPMVNTRAQAESFVAACRYPPVGNRSYGPARARLLYGAEYAARANTFALTFAMIETVEAVTNMDAIMSTPGLDGIYIGPADLSVSHGKPPATDLTDPDMLAVVDRIVAAAHRHGIIAGIHTATPEHALKMAAKGFRFVTATADNLLLQAGLESVVKKLRGA